MHGYIVKSDLEGDLVAVVQEGSPEKVMDAVKTAVKEHFCYEAIEDGRYVDSPLKTEVSLETSNCIEITADADGEQEVRDFTLIPTAIY